MHRTPFCRDRSAIPPGRPIRPARPGSRVRARREVKLLPKKVSLFQACKGSAHPDHLAVEDRALDARRRLSGVRRLVFLQARSESP